MNARASEGGAAGEWHLEFAAADGNGRTAAVRFENAGIATREMWETFLGPRAPFTLVVDRRGVRRTLGFAEEADALRFTEGPAGDDGPPPTVVTWATGAATPALAAALAAARAAGFRFAAA